MRLSLVLLLLLTGCSQSIAPSVQVEWTTASEINTAGFNLYRSESPVGPFLKINARLIPASPDAVAGGKYKYEDKDVRPGLTYYYNLEDVERGGTTTQHGPIKATASSGSELGNPALAAVGTALALGAGVIAWKRMRAPAKPRP